MRVLVVGAGAIGSVLGGFLAKAGHAVTLLGRPWHLDVVRRDGLRISGLWGDHRIRTLTVATEADAVAPEPFAWVLVCVKAHQTADAAATLPRWVGPHTYLCAFQNGLGNEERLTAHVPPERLALGRIIFGVELAAGHAHVTVCADAVRIGSPGGRVPDGKIRELVGALRDSGIPCQASPEILTVLWAKVLYNCALNGLATLFEVPYGRLPDLPGVRRLMEGIIHEAYRVADAQQVRLDPASPAAYLERLFGQLIPDTASHHPSMLQDVRAGKSTEIDAMNGAIVRLGETCGVPTPSNALVTRLVHAKERFAQVGR